MRRAIRMEEFGIATELEKDLQIVEKEAKQAAKTEEIQNYLHDKEAQRDVNTSPLHTIPRIVEWKHQSTVEQEHYSDAKDIGTNFGVETTSRPSDLSGSQKQVRTRMGKLHGRGGRGNGRGGSVLARLKRRASERSGTHI